METNISDVNSNNTLHQVIDCLNLNILKVNESEMNQNHLLIYNTVQKEQWTVFKSIIYIVGPLIVLSNLTVVISSGLILKNGLQPKSTYLLLGNVSLADIVIGLCLIFRVTGDNYLSSNPLCIFGMGLLLGPSMVSGYSIGLIAIDRYIYILYGLYYGRWISTTRVRIVILLTWIFGMIIGFLPATGLVNSDHINSCCSYVTLYPDSIILLNAFVGMVPFTVVVILYSKILVQALKTVKDLNTNVKATKLANKTIDNCRSRDTKTDPTTISELVEIPKTIHSTNSARSSSFPNSNKATEESVIPPGNIEHKTFKTNVGDNRLERMSEAARDSTNSDSKISVCTIETEISDNIREFDNIPEHENSSSSKPVKKVRNINKIVLKPSARNKWKAITVVLVSFGGFIVTCMPLYITVSFYVFCEDKMTNDRCLYIRYLLDGPFSALAYVNGMLNPLIYAWWHKGFRKSIKKSFQKYIKRKQFFI